MANIFMKATGVNGSATDSDYDTWISLDTLSFAVDNELLTKVGQMHNRVMKFPKFEEMLVSKTADAASNKLFRLACSREPIEKVEIHVCKTDAKQNTHMKYLFNDCIIASYQHSVVKESSPSEVIIINYARIEMHYLEYDASNVPKSPKIESFNLGTGEIS